MHTCSASGTFSINKLGIYVITGDEFKVYKFGFRYIIHSFNYGFKYIIEIQSHLERENVIRIENGHNI